MAAAPQPFTISVPDDVLVDLRERLARTRLPNPAPEPADGWEYGTNLAYLRELLDYWQNGFDWRAAEARLNELPQFTAEVDGTTLHFVHQKGVGPNPVPLLFSHGWPGSFWEVSKIIGPLTDPAAHGGDPADAFDVVAPSLPGYGFSPDPGRPGVNTVEIGNLFTDLMTDVLGYDRFVAQGGDWGSAITSAIARTHPDRVLGIHLNMMGMRAAPTPDAPPPTEAEQTFFKEQEAWRARETGYFQIQSTKPQTLAYALNDSPTGLAAWIVEKFRTWSDCGGDVERRFSKDDLLTNIMIYWVTGTIGSSVRLYFENTRNPMMLRPGEKITVPTGYSRFAVEISRPPREWVERATNLTHWADHPSGGHFAAVEEPAALVEDIRATFRPLRG